LNGDWRSSCRRMLSRAEQSTARSSRSLRLARAMAGGVTARRRARSSCTARRRRQSEPVLACARPGRQVRPLSRCHSSSSANASVCLAFLRCHGMPTFAIRSDGMIIRRSRSHASDSSVSVWRQRGVDRDGRDWMPARPALVEGQWVVVMTWAARSSSRVGYHMSLAGTSSARRMNSGVTPRCRRCATMSESSSS